MLNTIFDQTYALMREWVKITVRFSKSQEKKNDNAMVEKKGQKKKNSIQNT